MLTAFAECQSWDPSTHMWSASELSGASAPGIENTLLPAAETCTHICVCVCVSPSSPTRNSFKKIECMCIVVQVNEKRAHEFKREQGGRYMEGFRGGK